MLSKSTSQREGHECLFRILLGFLPGPNTRTSTAALGPSIPSLGSCEQPPEEVGTGLAQPGARRQYYSSTSQQVPVGMFQQSPAWPWSCEGLEASSYLISLTYFQSTKCQRQVPGMSSCTGASIGILDNSTQHGDVLSPKEHADR